MLTVYTRFNDIQLKLKALQNKLRNKMEMKPEEPKDEEQTQDNVWETPQMKNPKVTIEPGFNTYEMMVAIHQSTMTRSLDLLQEYDMPSQHTNKIIPGLVIKLKKMTLNNATAWLKENMPQTEQPKV
jgi:hypothetical protein